MTSLVLRPGHKFSRSPLLPLFSAGVSVLAKRGGRCHLAPNYANEVGGLQRGQLGRATIGAQAQCGLRAEPATGCEPGEINTAGGSLETIWCVCVGGVTERSPMWGRPLRSQPDTGMTSEGTWTTCVTFLVLCSAAVRVLGRHPVLTR